MAVTVETLEKLERKITLTLPVASIQEEVQTRLKRLARTAKMDGFRPGKVPMNVVSQRYGYSVQHEVVNDKVGQAFSDAVQKAELRVASLHSLTEKDGAPEGQVLFDAVFEVYPEVKLGDFSTLEIEKLHAEVDEAAIDKTIDILRKQRRTFAQKSLQQAAETGDRVNVDFEGKIDGEAFPGGQAKDVQFIIGEGQMLKEFEDAVLGMKSGESKTFPLSFPESYQNPEIAGKQADFLVTVNKVETTHLPEITPAIVKSLGIADGNVESLRADIRKNLELEVKKRLTARNKRTVIEALAASTQFDLPRGSVRAEIEAMEKMMRANMKERGIKGADTVALPEDMFLKQAEQRVHQGLVVAELVNAHKLHATPAQVKEHLQEQASTYERPEEVVRWYMENPEALRQAEAIVLENNVTEFVLSKAKVQEKTVTFDELMAAQSNE